VGYNPPIMKLFPNKISHYGLYLAVIIVSLCSITYELIIAQSLSVISGDTVTRYCTTIGIFLFSLGIGSFLVRWLKNSIVSIMWVEIGLSIIGGCSACIIFFVDTFVPLETYGEYLFSASWTVLIISNILIVIIGILSGMEIPLFADLISKEKSSISSGTLSSVLGWDYVGALIGAVMFPLVFYPKLGILRISFIIGILNLIVSAYLLIIYRKKIRLKLGYILAIAFSICLLLIGVYKALHIREYFDYRFLRTYNLISSEGKILFCKQTLYQRVIFAEDMDRLILILDQEDQFYSDREFVYHEAFVHPVMIMKEKKAKKILILGGGDGLLLREVLKYDWVERADQVDIDPVITNYALNNSWLKKINNGSLRDKRVKVFNADAAVYIRKYSDFYDIIFLDFPDIFNSKVTKLHTKEFYTYLFRALKKDGILVNHSLTDRKKANKIIQTNLHYAGFKDILPYRAVTCEIYNEKPYPIDNSMSYLSLLYLEPGEYDIPELKVREFSEWQSYYKKQLFVDDNLYYSYYTTYFLAFKSNPLYDMINKTNWRMAVPTRYLTASMIPVMFKAGEIERLSGYNRRNIHSWYQPNYDILKNDLPGRKFVYRRVLKTVKLLRTK
jgi:spermidine synthase